VARRALSATITTLTTTAALLLAGCGGGGDDSSPEDIKGADSGASSPSTSASVPASAGQPDLSLPSDLKVQFDVTAPSDAKHAAALINAKNYILALNHGITA